MNWFVLTFVATFTASAMLAVGVRAIALRLGAVDQPDGKRKLHHGPIARWGGIGVYLALCAGLFIARFGESVGSQSYRDLATVLGVAAGVVCLFGAIDDRWCLGTKLKLLLQVAAVVPVVCFGFWMKTLYVFGYPVDLGWFGIPITVLWLLGCVNALNLLDGMDGLAATIGAMTAAMIAVLATGFGHPHVAAIALILAASLAGFLVHNLPPARIFLGDSGSMVIGLVLGVLALQSAMKTPTTMAIALPAVIMSLPMLDTVLAVVRRKLTGRKFDAADREHVHHRLLNRGFTPWQSLCVLGAFCLVTGGAAAISAWLHNEALAWIAAAAAIGAAIRMRLFGNYELALVIRGVTRLLVRLGQRLEEGGWQTAATADDSEMERAWSRAVERVRALRGHRIEAVWSDSLGRACRCGWSDPKAEGHGKGWSLAVTAARDDGHSCEVFVSGMDDAAETGREPAGAMSDLALLAVELCGCREALSADGGDSPPGAALRLIPQPNSRAA